jgi:hypothetical protein
LRDSFSGRERKEIAAAIICIAYPDFVEGVIMNNVSRSEEGVSKDIDIGLESDANTQLAPVRVSVIDQEVAELDMNHGGPERKVQSSSGIAWRKVRITTGIKK